MMQPPVLSDAETMKAYRAGLMQHCASEGCTLEQIANIFRLSTRQVSNILNETKLEVPTCEK